MQVPRPPEASSLETGRRTCDRGQLMFKEEEKKNRNDFLLEINQVLVLGSFELKIKNSI